MKNKTNQEKKGKKDRADVVIGCLNPIAPSSGFLQLAATSCRNQQHLNSLHLFEEMKITGIR